MANKDPITWKGSTDKPTIDNFSWTYNPVDINAWNSAIYDQVIWETPAPTGNTEITTPAPTPVWTDNLGGIVNNDSLLYSSESSTSEVTNPYDLNANDILNKKYNIGAQYANAVSSFNKWDIVEKMRLKTGWVADLDSAIENLKVDLNKSRPMLMERYANVIDPQKREALISAEESNIAKQINDLSATRKYRLGTIKEMTDAEITTQENKLKWLEAQYNLYSSVLWDITKADQVKRDMDKTALEIQKQQLELKTLEDKYWLEFVKWKTSLWSTDFTNLQSKYPNNASFKNNNPGNIKYNTQWANTLANYGIEISKWTPATDWGNFAKYNSIEDALWGRDILLFRTSTYPNMTVDSAMKRYSNGWYGAEITWVDWNKLMKDLTPSEKATLIKNQLKGEDQAMYQEMIAQGINPEKIVIQWWYKKTWLSEEEKKAKEYSFVTAKDFTTAQNSSAENLVTKMTPEDVNKVLEDNIGKWEIPSSAVDKLLGKATDEVYNKYIEEEVINWLKEETDVDTIVQTVEDLLESYTEQEVMDILKKAWAFDKKWFKKGFFNDDSWYDKLQELLPSL